MLPAAINLSPQQSSAVLNHLLSSPAIALVLLDQDGVIQACNPGLCVLLGSQASPIGERLADYLDRAGGLLLTQLLQGLQTQGRVSLGANGLNMPVHCQILSAGDAKQCLLWMEHSCDGENAAELMLKISGLNNQLVNTVREMRRKQKALEQANVTINKLLNLDALTDLANRRSLMHHLNEYLQDRRSSNPFSLVMLDIDHFKAINDTYGHDIGDEVLKAVGRTLTQGSRENDLPARVGGEEFVILLPATDQQGAFIFAEKIRTLSRLIQVPGTAQHITMSLGVTQKQPQDTPASILKRADNALYQAKRSGRDQTVLYQAAG